MTGEYAFRGVPVPPARAGTSVLVAGSSHAGARELALRMLTGPGDEGTILVSTNDRAASLAERCESVGMAVSPDRVGIVDCVGDDTESLPARVLPVTGPGDLTGIGIRFSTLCQDLHDANVAGIRTGVLSLSTLLSFSDLQTVSRFVHTLTGRIDVERALGVFLVDPAAVDDRSVSTVGQFCDARIDVREGDASPELRVRGIPNASREWTEFDPYTV